jgi:hypothetical protein
MGERAIFQMGGKGDTRKLDRSRSVGYFFSGFKRTVFAGQMQRRLLAAIWWRQFDARRIQQRRHHVLISRYGNLIQCQNKSDQPAETGTEKNCFVVKIISGT